jgi:hypothetical protein
MPSMTLGPAFNYAKNAACSAHLGALAKQVIHMRQPALPASQLAKTYDYQRNQWKRFRVFAADGVVEIDNDWCEPELSAD